MILQFTAVVFLHPAKYAHSMMGVNESTKLPLFPKVPLYENSDLINEQEALRATNLRLKSLCFHKENYDMWKKYTLRKT